MPPSLADAVDKLRTVANAVQQCGVSDGPAAPRFSRRLLQDAQPQHQRKPARMVRDVPVHVQGPEAPVLTVHRLARSRKYLWHRAHHAENLDPRMSLTFS